ncbi:MAG: tRNA lysidine(34) synthetase TilS [Cyanobacteria bacterium J06581_3]
MTWSLAHAKLHILLRARVLLPRNSRILMAVSGGQDSLCLAQLLVDLCSKWQWSLALVHCDHRWRTDSADNAAHVLNLAERWGVPAWLEVADQPLESEAMARHWRYDRLAVVARAQGYDYLVTGHTESDRAETVLYNLIRGTGTDGIGTLPWVRSLDSLSPPIHLVRPLLTFSRPETADVCEQQQLPVWEDSSNQNLNFRRNRIRQELLPYLREHFNPQTERALAQLAEIAAAETAYLSEQAAALYTQTVSAEQQATAHKVWEIKRVLLNKAPLALQRRVIRQLLQTAIASPPNFFHIEKMIELLAAPNGTMSDPYPGNWIAQVCGSVIRLSKL